MNMIQIGIIGVAGTLLAVQFKSGKSEYNALLCPTVVRRMPALAQADARTTGIGNKTIFFLLGPAAGKPGYFFRQKAYCSTEYVYSSLASI